MKKIKKKKIKWNVSEIKMLFWGSLSLCSLTAAIIKVHPSHDLKQHKFRWMMINEVDGSHKPSLSRKKQHLVVRKSPAYCGAFIILAGSFIDDEDQFQSNHNFQAQNHKSGHKHKWGG